MVMFETPNKSARTFAVTGREIAFKRSTIVSVGMDTRFPVVFGKRFHYGRVNRRLGIAAYGCALVANRLVRTLLDLPNCGFPDSPSSAPWRRPTNYPVQTI